MKKLIIAGVVIVAILVVILVIVLGGSGDDNEEAAGELNVAVNLEGAKNVGSISLGLTYDSTVLKAADVKLGDMAGNAMLEYNLTNPGQVVIGIIDSSGIEGDGSVAVISFNVVGEKGTSTLGLTEVLTHDATTLVDIINTKTDGQVDVASESVTPPVIRFNQ